MKPRRMLGHRAFCTKTHDGGMDSMIWMHKSTIILLFIAID